MPTYRNDKTKTLVLKNLDWEDTIVVPGDTIETYEFIYIDGLVKISDTPLFNRVTANKSVTLTETPADYFLHPETTNILVCSITGSATVTTGDEYPGQIPVSSADETIKIVIERPRVFYEKLRLSGSGTCTVMEFRQWPWETPDGH